MNNKNSINHFMKEILEITESYGFSAEDFLSVIAALFMSACAKEKISKDKLRYILDSFYDLYPAHSDYNIFKQPVDN